jgi:iron complex transport system substrate-binding protein
MKKRILAFLSVTVMLLSIAACAAQPAVISDEKTSSEAGLSSASPAVQSPGAGAADVSPAAESAGQDAGSAGSAAESAGSAAETVSPPAPVIDKDREGNTITLPDSIDRIISMGPSNTEVLVALGFEDIIIAADSYSSNIDGLKKDIPLFSMMSPDGEQIINLEPDVIFVTGMSKAGGDDPYKVVADAGICVVYMPSSSSIEGICEDIRYLSVVMGAVSRGDEIITGMTREIETIRTVCSAIAEKRSVYFEIGAAPYMYSFGKGVFLNEMLEIIGAINIFADQEKWISVADEAILDANPDVILTSVNYIEDPVGEIKARPGWDRLTAVQNGDVYYIDTDSSNRPSHNIIIALKEMAVAVYPDKF